MKITKKIEEQLKNAKDFVIVYRNQRTRFVKTKTSWKEQSSYGDSSEWSKFRGTLSFNSNNIAIDFVKNNVERIFGKITSVYINK